MKITALETIRTREHDNLLWVHVETDTGLIGLGETFYAPGAVEAFIHNEIATNLLGQDATRINAINAKLARPMVGYASSGVEMRAASAIDIALWDIAGQACGQPLHRLFGGLARDRVRIYNTCAGPHYVKRARGNDIDSFFGLDQAPHPLDDLRAFLEEPERLARELLAEGVTGMKIWPFDRAAYGNGGNGITTAQIDEGLAPFRRIRDAVGPVMDLMVELHGLWDMPSVKRIIAALEDVSPFWFEDPIRMDDAEGLAELARFTRVPILASETLGPAPAFRRLLEQRGVGIVSLDAGWCGGFTQALAIAAMAAASQIPIAPHDCTGPVNLFCGAQLSLSQPNGFIQETVRAYLRGWYSDVATDLPRIENGWLYPPQRPGVGTALRPDFLGNAGTQRRRSAES